MATSHAPPSNPFSVLSEADPEEPGELDPLPRRQRPEAGTQVAAPQAAAAPSVLPDLAADAGRLPTVEAIEEEALRVAVEEAQRLNAADGAACAEATQAAKEATGKRQQEDGERRRRSKMVQNIALCDKLGVKTAPRAPRVPPTGRRG